ncbi:MAG: Transcriptional regulator, family [Mycobacterium sp.]|jgi:transcriptional regulator with XRE-family HTH domain|nr:Transcriptional regulator, family [Mycobacterium sp.]
MTADDFGDRLGAAIRRRRRAQGITLVQLAERSALSDPFLSQLERGLARPSMESLHRIARALGTTTPGLLSALAPDEQAVGISLTRAGQGATVEHELGWTRSRVEGERAMYPVEFMVTSDLYESYYQHEVAEFIYLLSGELEVDLDVEGTHLIAAGDVLYFPGGVRHRWRASGGPAHALVVQAGQHPHA